MVRSSEECLSLGEGIPQSIQLPTPQLAAGGVDVAAQGPADRSADAAVLQNFLEPLHRRLGAGHQGAFLHPVQGDKIHMGREALQPPQQLLGIVGGVVHPVDHGIFKGNPPGSSRIVPAAGGKQRLHIVCLIHGHNAVPNFIIGRMEGHGQRQLQLPLR